MPTPPSDTPPPPAIARAKADPWVWLFAGIAVLVRVAISLGTRFTNEDSLITLRYAENLAHGHGLVYNLGERVLGTTTPLYALMLAGAAALGADASAVGKAVNILADGALCLVLAAWLAQMGHAPAGRVAAFLVAVHPWHVRWSVAGMETSLVTLCGAAAWLAWSRRKTTAAYALLGVLFVLRWDSVLLLAALTAATLWRDRRIPWRGLATYAAVIAPWLIVATVYYGSPIPVTAASKWAVYSWPGIQQLFPGQSAQAGLADRFFGNPLSLGLLAAAGFGLLRALKSTDAQPLLAAGIWSTAYHAIIALSPVLLFEWYLVPALPVLECLAAIGLVGVWQDGQNITARWPGAVRISAQALAAATVAALCVGRAWELCERGQRVEEAVRRPLGLWLRERARPGDTVMLEPIGYIGYTSRLRVLDVIGLVSPQVRPYWRRGQAAPLAAMVQRFRPEWCVLRPRELNQIGEGGLAFWTRNYDLATTYSYRRPGAEPVIFHVYRRR